MTAIVSTGEMGSPGSDIPRHFVNIFNARIKDRASIAALSARHHQPWKFWFGRFFVTAVTHRSARQFHTRSNQSQGTGTEFYPGCAIERECKNQIRRRFS